MTHGKPPGGTPRTTLRGGAFETIPDTGSTPMPPSNLTSESSAVAPNGTSATSATSGRATDNFFILPPGKSWPGMDPVMETRAAPYLFQGFGACALDCLDAENSSYSELRKAK